LAWIATVRRIACTYNGQADAPSGSRVQGNCGRVVFLLPERLRLQLQSCCRPPNVLHAAPKMTGSRSCQPFTAFSIHDRDAPKILDLRRIASATLALAARVISPLVPLMEINAGSNDFD
jgi:hypothetical protein